MSSVNGQMWAAAVAQQRAELERALGYQANLERAHDARRAEVAKQAQVAMGELTASVLPLFSADNLRYAAQVAGYAPLAQRDLVGACQAEQVKLAAEIAAIEATDHYQRREYWFDPRHGKHAREVAEINEALQPLELLLQRAAHERLEHLLAAGYGTPSYNVPFWRLSYYSDWEAGDEILERFPGKSFSEVRDEHLATRGSVGSLRARRAELEQAQAAGEAMLRRHAELKRLVATTVERHLAQARSALERHIVQTGEKAMGPRLCQVPGLDMLTKRAFGLLAKLGYLDGLALEQLGKTRQELTTTLSRLGAEHAKWSRPKKAYVPIPLDRYNARFRSGKPPRHQRAWQRYQRGSDTVYAFDRYDRGRFDPTFLWWDTMTEGRVDGDFLPAVAQHRQRYPNHAYQRPDDDERREVLAALGGRPSSRDDELDAS